MTEHVLPEDDLARLNPGDPGLAAWAAPDPEQRPDLWPAGISRNPAGELTWHGTPLSVLLSDAPPVRGIPTPARTPVFLLDLPDFRSRAQAFREAFATAFADEGGAQVHYAAKAFLSLEIAREASGQGLGLDTAAAGELELALASGCEPSLIGLHGNGKTEELLSAAVGAGIGRIILDSFAEITRLQRVLDAQPAAGRIPVMLRVTTGVHAGGHEYIATAHEDQKFGLSLTPGAYGNLETWRLDPNESPALAAVRAVLADERLELVGLHSHIGSQIVDLAGFVAAAKTVLEFRGLIQSDTGYLVPELDLGGGYGIAYTGRDTPAPSPLEFASGLYQAVQEAVRELGQPFPRISVEPGRAIVGPSGITLYRVVNIKDQPVGTHPDGGVIYRRYVTVDGGMSDNIRPALYGADYTAALVNRRPEGEMMACRVVGSHCESGDIVVSDVALPEDLDEGDLLAVPVTGAYGWAMSSNYNWFTRCGVLGLDNAETGTVVTKWLLEPETQDTMLAYFDPAYRDFLGTPPLLA